MVANLSGIPILLALSMFRRAFTVSMLTLLSRLFGYMRDILIASTLGAGPLMEGYIVAFRLPNLFRTLFAEGAFSAAFVPCFAKMHATQGDTASRDFINHIFTLFAVILIGFVSLLQIAMPWCIYALVPGFTGEEERFFTAILFSRITMPYLFFISLVSMLSGILQTMGRFAAAAAAPIYLNLCMIFGITILAKYTQTPAHGLVISITMAGIVQFLALWWACRGIGWMPRFVRPRLTPEIRSLFRKIVPGVVGSASTQINLLVNTMMASLIPGGMAFLYYADRVVQLPLSLTGTALGTVMLPLLTQKIQAGALQEATQLHNRAITLALLLVLPAATALAMIALPIITILFERNAFTATESLHTAHAMQALAFGLPAFVLLKLMIPPFFAHHDTKTPVMVALFCIVLNILLNLLLIWQYHHVGIAISTALTAWVNLLLLLFLLMRRDWWHADRLLLLRLTKILFSCGVMAAILWYVETRVPSLLPLHLQEPNLHPSLFHFALLVISGGGSYFISLIALRTVPKQEIVSMLRKGDV